MSFDSIHVYVCTYIMQENNISFVVVKNDCMYACMEKDVDVNVYLYV